MQHVDIRRTFDYLEDAESSVLGAVANLANSAAYLGHGLPITWLGTLLHQAQIRTGLDSAADRKATKVIERRANPVRSVGDSTRPLDPKGGSDNMRSFSNGLEHGSVHSPAGLQFALGRLDG